MKAIAKVVTSIVAGDSVAERPEDHALHRHGQGDPTPKQATMLAATGQSAV